MLWFHCWAGRGDAIFIRSLLVLEIAKIIPSWVIFMFIRHMIKLRGKPILQLFRLVNVLSYNPLVLHFKFRVEQVDSKNLFENIIKNVETYSGCLVLMIWGFVLLYYLSLFELHKSCGKLVVGIFLHHFSEFEDQIFVSDWRCCRIFKESLEHRFLWILGYIFHMPKEQRHKNAWPWVLIHSEMSQLENKLDKPKLIKIKSPFLVSALTF